MGRIRWTLAGVLGAGLAVGLLSQSVRGQVEPKSSTGVLPPNINLQPVLPSVSPPAVTGPLSPVPDTKVELLPRPGQGSIPIGGSKLPVDAGAPAFTAQPPGAQKTPRPAETLQALKGDEVPAGTPLFEVRTGKQQPAVSLEWIAPPTIRIQQSMPCQLLVRNTSNIPVHNVVVRQRLQTGMTCKSSEPQAVSDGEELIWNLGTLAPEQTRKLDLVLVSQVRGMLVCQATVTFTGAASHQVRVHEPKLVVKMRAPEKIIVGESVTLSFLVSNPGDGVAEAVKVRAVLPDGLEHSRGKVVEVDVGNLAPKDMRPLQLTCVAKGSGVQKCMVMSMAEGGITANDTAQVEILTPKLEAVMSGPKLRYLDRRAVYVLKVTNPGSAPAGNVEVQGVLPPGLKYQKSEPRGQYVDAAHTVTWMLGELLPGQTREISLEATPVEAGEHRVTAQLKSSRGVKAQAEANTTVEGLPSLFIELAHAEDTIEVGAETAYELHVTNTGTKTETNVEVVCTLPEQLQFKGAKCSTTLQYRIEGRDVIFNPLPRLAKKADVIYRIQVQGTAAGDVRFRTRIRTDDMREPIVREERTRIYNDESPAQPGTPGVPTAPGAKVAPMSKSDTSHAPDDLPGLPDPGRTVIPAGGKLPPASKVDPIPAPPDALPSLPPPAGGLMPATQVPLPKFQPVPTPMSPTPVPHTPPAGSAPAGAIPPPPPALPIPEAAPLIPAPVPAPIPAPKP